MLRLLTDSVLYLVSTLRCAVFASTDLCVFGQLYDDKVTGMLTDDVLAKYKHLNALYKSVSEIPAIAEYIKKVTSA
jgi:Glutathione S-transferase, C-terminal domain